MILSKTPFRISFAGGGSDLPEFYRRRTGTVVSTTIDKSMYIAIHPYFHDKIRIKYSRTEDVSEIAEIEHPLVRECLRMLNIGCGMEIASFADVPAGTGMGSSSAFTVGLLHALHALAGRSVGPERLAEAACRVEIERVAEPIGKQDQYATAYGGLNAIRFHPDETVEVRPLACSPFTREELGSRLMLFYIGQERAASSILGSAEAHSGRRGEIWPGGAHRRDLARGACDRAGEEPAGLVRRDPARRLGTQVSFGARHHQRCHRIQLPAGAGGQARRVERYWAPAVVDFSSCMRSARSRARCGRRWIICGRCRSP